MVVFTVAAACHEVLRGLLKHRGGTGSFIKDNDLVSEDRRAEFLRIINRPNNFLKHADRDPEETLDLGTLVLEFQLLDCVRMYGRLGNQLAWEKLVYFSWFAVTYPDYILEGAFKDLTRDLKARVPNPGDKNLMLELLRNRP